MVALLKVVATGDEADVKAAVDLLSVRCAEPGFVERIRAAATRNASVDLDRDLARSLRLGPADEE